MRIGPFRGFVLDVRLAFHKMIVPVVAGLAALVATQGFYNSVAGPQQSEPDSDWRSFRGNNGRGFSQDKAALPNDLNNSLIWKTKIPEGHSSPLIIGDLIIITGYEGNRLMTLGLDRLKGSIRWQHEVVVEDLEKVYHHGPATPTATSDGQRVFVVFGSFGLLALDLQGTEIWRHPWKLPKNLYGTAASPTLVDDLLIVVNSDQDHSSLIALERNSGKVRWERTTDGAASTWATPVVWDHPEGKLILVYEPFHLRGIDPRTGTELWNVPNLADEPITLPQIVGDQVIVTSYNMGTNREVLGVPTFDQILKECDANGDQHLEPDEVRVNRSVLSRPDADGEGDHPLGMFFRMLDANRDGRVVRDEWPRMQGWVDEFKHANGFLALSLSHPNSAPTLKWQQAEGVPECPTPLVVGDQLYAIRNGGVLTLLNLSDGKTGFQERLLGGGPYYSSPVGGDQKLFFASARGEVSVVEVNSIPKVLSKRELGEPVWATPAIGSGTLIIRSKSTLWAFHEPAE